MSRRIGRFYVSVKMVEDEPASLAQILTYLAFVPLRVECLWAGRQFEYIGISPMFKDMPEGTVTPEYDLTIHTNEGELETVGVKEVTP